MKKDSTYNDPLQELLRRHLLETDGNEEKADLLNRISEKAMQSEPSLVMSEAKKAEMLLRLKNQLPPPGPGGGTGSGLSGWTIPSIAGLVLLSVTAFFFLKKPAEDTIQKTEIKSEQNTAVSDELLNKETAHTDNISGDLNDPDFVLQPGKQSIDPNQKNNLAVSGTDPGKSATNLTYSVPVPGGLPSVPPDKPFSFFELIQSTSTVPLTKKMSPGRELFIAGEGGTVFYFPAG